MYKINTQLLSEILALLRARNSGVVHIHHSNKLTPLQRVLQPRAQEEEGEGGGVWQTGMR